MHVAFKEIYIIGGQRQNLFQEHFIFAKCSTYNLPVQALEEEGTLASVTRESGRLKPFDSSPVLQYGSGPSPEFLAKILSVNTLLFLCNTRFYFPLFHCCFISLKEVSALMLSAIVQFVYKVGGWGSIPNEVIFFNSLHIFIFFLTLFAFESEGVFCDYCNCLFLKQFSSFNCFFTSRIVLTANIFCHVSLILCFILTFGPSCRCLEGELFIFNCTPLILECE
jgi:hypothetical protein